MKKIWIWTFMMFFCLFAQEQNVRIYGKEKEAYQYFQAGRYDQSTVLYEELLKDPKNNTPEFLSRAYQALFKMYKSMHNYSKALDWCKKYLEQNVKDSSVRLEYADLLKINKNYEKSLEIYASLISERMRNPNLKKRYEESRWALLNQDSIREAMVVKTNLTIRDNLGFTIFKDSLYASTILSSKDKTMPFYQISSFKIKDSLTIDTLSHPFFDASNRLLNTGSPSFNKTGDEIYYTGLDNKKTYYEALLNKNKKNDNNLKIVFAEKKADGKWSDPKTLEFCMPQYNYTHPFLTTDGKKLFFASDQDNKFGNYDLFVVKKTGDNWGNPRKISSNVNSDRTEMFPIVYKEYLFFASYGRESFGGADLFRSKMVGDQFELAENLGQPINSSKDDFSIFFTDSVKNSGYFTSNRANDLGHDDLYYVKVLNDFKLVEKPLTDSMKQAKEERLLFISALDKKSLNAVDIDVQVFEKNNEKKDSVLLTIETNMAGEKFVKIDSKKEYSAVITSNNQKNKQYIPALQTLKTDELIFFVDDPNEPNLSLSEKEVVALKPYTPTIEERLFFEFDRFNVLELEKIKLYKIIELLKKDSNLLVLLEGHTDSRGKDWYNDNLSRRRVVKVMEYLKIQGVPRSQILFAFFGKRRLISQDENINRRVESRIVYKK